MTLAVFLTLAGIGGTAAAGPHEDAASAYGRGDYASALRLYRSLAERGDAYAQNYLGIMYQAGQGVPLDYVQAYKWFMLARYNLAAQFPVSDKDRNIILRNREVVAEKMTPEQIAEAQKLAREWRPR